MNITTQQMSQLINHLLEEHDGHFTMLYQVDFQEDKVVYTVKKEVNSSCSCRPEVTWMIQEPQEIVYNEFFKDHVQP